MNTMRKCSTCGQTFAGDLCPKCMAGFAQKSTEPTAPPEELPLKPGQTFHGLEILEMIGKGGMGVVYKARQPALDRLVALKILPQKMALDPDFQNRFIREAKALGSLSHPNIVAVYDFGADSGLFFFAMEFVDGTNLRQILRDRKLPAEQALKIVPQLCDALEYAHGEGVVHRDIKPENILLDKKGRVKIADFGLAKLVGADVAAAGMLTVTNMVMGTPHYMAPEQVENPKGVDHRADIYAIGVVFYEMLTGELPIGRFEMPSKKVQIDVRLDDVVLKALEKSPDRRYQNASDIKDAVTKATTVSAVDSYSPTVITPKPAVKGSNKGMLLMAMVTAAAVIVAVVALLRGPKPEQSTTTMTIGRTTTVPEPAKPPAAEPFDFAKIYFGPSERPGGYVFQQPGTGLPRNPMVCKETQEIEVLVKILDDIGLQNVARSDVKQGYLSAWFRWEVAFVALESPISTRLETEFQGMQTPENRWTWRKGDVLVLAWTRRKENRDVFSDLVLRLQKKLGIADQAPEIPLQHLTLEKTIAPDGFTFTVDVQDPAGQTPREISVLNLKVQGAVQRFAATISATETGTGVLTYSAINFVTPQAAAAAEKRLASHLWPATAHVVRTEVLRSGGSVAVLLLLSPEVHLYERVASQVRSLLGLADHTFDTIIPVAGEMPAGYQLGETRTDVAAIVKDLGIDNVSPTQVARAWQAKVKPAGSIVVLQVEETDVRSRIREELKKRGASEENSGTTCVFGIEGPDEETLDALENLLRFKFGWDGTTPRPVLIHRLQLKPSDLPEGYSLEGVVFEKRLWKAELRGPQGALQFVARESHNYAEIDAIRKELAPKPGDVQLFRYAIVSQVTNPGGEAAWPALDALEAMLRKKMRLGPPTAEEYSLEKSLPPNCQLIPRRDVGFAVNPRQLKSPVAVQQAIKEVWATEIPGFIRGWAALIQPAETQVWILEAPESAKMSDLVARVRKAVPAAKNVAIHEKGSIVAVVRSDRPEDGEFKAVDAIVRAKLRAK